MVTKANQWTCDGCRKTFDIVDVAPKIDEEEFKIDVTSFGDWNAKYISSKIIQLHCPECDILF